MTAADKSKAVAHYEALAVQALAYSKTLQALTLYPYIVRVSWDGPEGDGCALQVVEASAAPTGFELVPESATRVGRIEVVPAERLVSMPEGARPYYTHLYRAYVAWRWARAGRALDGMALDQQVYEWAHPRGNRAGD